jgi:hypothetical protein
MLTGLLGGELPMAPLRPLRRCPHLVVLHISILTPVSFPPLCDRNQARSVVFEAAFGSSHWFLIFHFTGIQVPIVNDSVGKEFLRVLLV